MKLIDLLVQELPNRGGWKFGRNSVYQDWDGELRIDSECGSSTKIFLPLNEVFRERAKMKISLSDDAFVTREQYEAALAASKQPEWSGEGLPPIGCECVASQPGQICGKKFRVAALSEGVVFGFWSNGTPAALDSYRWMFSPIRTEAERKRDNAISAMIAILEGGTSTNDDARDIYLAISAGKIPGIRIE